jgi:hypothetical protein
MKEIKLTKGQIAIVDDEDFEDIKIYKWEAKIRKARKQSYVYVERRIYCKGKEHRILLAREIMKPKKNEIVIHINRNPLDNRKINLRIVDRSQLVASRELLRGTTILHGVTKSKNLKYPYIARIQFRGDRLNIGNFSTEIDAAIARDLAAIEIHKDFATLNFSFNFLNTIRMKFYEQNPHVEKKIREMSGHELQQSSFWQLLLLLFEQLIKTFVGKSNNDASEKNK